MRTAEFHALRLQVLEAALAKARTSADVDRYFAALIRPRNQLQLEQALVRLGLVNQ